MRFSLVITGIVATLSTVSALPKFIPFGSLPSQPTDADLMNKDLVALANALEGLVTAIQNAVDAKKGGQDTTRAFQAILTGVISVQSNCQTARLDANGIRGPFDADPSQAVVDVLKKQVSPGFETVYERLINAVEEGVFDGTSGTNLRLVVASYLDLCTTDAAKMTDIVVSSVADSVKPGASAAADSVKAPLKKIDDDFPAEQA
ncbi:hypothetical protein LY78DRAFT_276782 [Colletotrichum sublineola]|uniref:Cell wall protein n=1 Tax=Colletotrichum sublineola TaxID=1173701 RepID=A0A066X9Y3_COLSU|nr:hypothetical protein LY78DRAFT_276782 [Colletotrichum sublineola]KDN62556.1 hypothetical protein CSUB01_02273 [Colletotrichum sublineola]